VAKENFIKKVYNFYSRDLTSNEFERIILKETPIRYKYFVRSIDKTAPHKNKIVESLTFIRNFTIAFLTKLSPVIRIIYSAAILIFIYAFVLAQWDLAALSFIVVNLLLLFEVADKLTAKDELEVARDVQTNLIPLHAPENNEFEVVCHYETAREVGGDFIDFISKPDGSYLISIGDVSGKGMSAALYMMQVRLLLRHLTEFFDNPKSILASLNKNIFKHIKKGLYFSVTLADIQGKNLKICRAGHTPLLYYDSAKRICSEIKQKGMALGLSNGDMFESSLEEYELTPNTNDILVFYSDGLTETMNTGKNEFGLERIKDLLILNSHKSAGEIKTAIVDEVDKFRGYAEVHDDLTMIILKAK